MVVEVVTIEKGELHEMLKNVLSERSEKPQPEVMTLSQVCEYLGVTAPTVRENIKKGMPVSYRLGEKSPRFLKRRIDAWLNGEL